MNHLGSYAPIEVGTSRWVIAAEEPRSAALAPLRVLIPILALIAVFAGALGWVFGARLWRQFAGKLRQLSDVVQRAQRGDTSARLENKASGPVGELSSSIDRLLEERLQSMLVAPRPEFLATAGERGASERLAALAASLEGIGTPEAEALRERIRRLEGAIAWDLRTEYHERLYVFDGHLDELARAIEVLNASYESFVRARQAAVPEHRAEAP